MNPEFNLTTTSGLTESEAARRLAKDGYNELPSSARTSALGLLVGIVTEPMFILLVSCGVLYLVLGEPQDASLLLGFVFICIGITFYQERKTQRALEALRDLSSPRALVIRGGRRRRIPGREVVRDDLIMLSEGDRVPADAALLYATNMSVNESLLTGEAMPVRKIEWDGATQHVRPGGDDMPFVYSGTLVVQGQGIARVYAAGMQTELGKIGKALQSTQAEEPLLRRETGRIVRVVSVIGLGVCVVLVLVYGMLNQTENTVRGWINALLAGLTLAMATLPEEIPVVLTIFLALGAWRMSKKNVLARSVPAVETLGAATVLCVDKTGTLTMNEMAVNELFVEETHYDMPAHSATALPEEFHRLVEYSVLASKRDPFDPMEKALRRLGEFKLSETEHLHDDWSLVREYPLSRALLALSRVWQSPDGTQYTIAAKGAPEAIADLCHLDDARRDALLVHVRTMAQKGLRVIGVASSHFTMANLPGEQHDFVFEFLGLIGLADPVRPTVAQALRECYTAGLRVIMITGDYPETARTIARQIGLVPHDRVITGAELDSMDDATLAGQIGGVNVFARVVPEQKLRIVDALKKAGEIVAMTGDGVNDAPALKSAHIGIAMGARGTDVARESAELVLVDDDFSSIVAAVRMGRRIFDNLRKAMAYIFSIHVPIAGMSLLPVLLGLPPLLLPVHIVFLELIIDPACSVVFEAEEEEKDIMLRPPRRRTEPLCTRNLVFLSLLQGFFVFAALAVVFSFAVRLGRSEAETRSLVFTTLIVANLCLILINRSWSSTMFAAFHARNKALIIVLVGALALLALVLYVPFLMKLFKFTTMHIEDLALCLCVAVISILWFEVFKGMQRRHRRTELKPPPPPTNDPHPVQ